MVGESSAPGRSADRLIVAGLGPGDLDRLPAAHRAVLEDPARAVVVRTMHHPAAAQLASIRRIESCDDLYEAAGTFDDVYAAITERVEARAADGPVVFAVPGSPLVGEFAVRRLLERVRDVEVLVAESFLDAVLRAVGYDPFDRGLRIINGHELPDPLVLDVPSVIGHLDAPAVLADVAAAVGRVVPDGTLVTVCAGVGSSDEMVLTVPIDEVPADAAGFRTSLYVDAEPGGVVGAIHVNRRLRRDCPWDREQTHHSLVAHLMEETAELAEALARLPEDGADPDWVAYDAVEEELGDVLLQVLFHASIAAERGAFDIDDVATRLRDKLVRRHPHVFGDVEVADADEVAANWDRIKATEKAARSSLMDGVPESMAALERAAKVQRRAASVGFDWEDAADVVGALAAEVEEVRTAVAGAGDPGHEIGDVLFSAVNLARRLDLDPDVLMRRATHRFTTRFRLMEEMGPLEGLDADDFESRWRAAKSGEAAGEGAPGA